MSKETGNNEFNQEPNRFGLPDGYFNRSALSIQTRIEWIEEHKAYPKLQQLKGESGFMVPASYFEKQSAAAEMIPYSQLSQLKGSNPFNIPSNYFEEKEITLMQALMQEQQEELKTFATLSSIEKKNVFEVKEDHFNLSKSRISEELSAAAKVVQLFRTHLWYSSAAAILVITLGIWLFTRFFGPVEKDCTSLACINRSELLKNKNLENVDNDELFEMVDANKLKKTLEKKEDEKKVTDSSQEVSTDDLPDDI